MLPLLLVVLILVLPVLELLVIVQVAQEVGGWTTALLLVVQGVLGAWIVKREGRRAWRRLNEAVASGRMPERGPADAALILAGGALLALPGFLTDVPALLCLLPFTRPAVRKGLMAWAARRAARAGLPPEAFSGGLFEQGRTIRPDGSGGPAVIRGEVLGDEEDGEAAQEERRPLEP